MEPSDLYTSVIVNLNKCCTEIEIEKNKTLLKLNLTICGPVGASRHKTSICDEDIEKMNKQIDAFVNKATLLLATIRDSKI